MTHQPSICSDQTSAPPQGTSSAGTQEEVRLVLDSLRLGLVSIAAATHGVRSQRLARAWTQTG